MSDTTEDVDFTNNDNTEETTVEQSQETLESESQYEDDGLTPQARAFKEKRREENRQAREALKELPSIKAKLEFTEFLRKTPQAEEYEKDITDFRAKNPTISLTDSFRYVLADKNPAALVSLEDEPSLNKMTQSRNTMSGGDKSFSEQIEATPANTPEQLRKEAMKEMSKLLG